MAKILKKHWYLVIRKCDMSSDEINVKLKYIHNTHSQRPCSEKYFQKVHKNGQCIIKDISDVTMRSERTLQHVISRGLCCPIIVSANYQPLDKSNRKALFRMWGRVKTRHFYCHCNQATWLYRLLKTWQFWQSWDVDGLDDFYRLLWVAFKRFILFDDIF